MSLRVSIVYKHNLNLCQVKLNSAFKNHVDQENFISTASFDNFLRALINKDFIVFKDISDLMDIFFKWFNILLEPCDKWCSYKVSFIHIKTLRCFLCFFSKGGGYFLETQVVHSSELCWPCVIIYEDFFSKKNIV